jgi:hypothetical protein
LGRRCLHHQQLLQLQQRQHPRRPVEQPPPQRRRCHQKGRAAVRPSDRAAPTRPRLPRATPRLPLSLLLVVLLL